MKVTEEQIERALTARNKLVALIDMIPEPASEALADLLEAMADIAAAAAIPAEPVADVKPLKRYKMATWRAQDDSCDVTDMVEDSHGDYIRYSAADRIEVLEKK